jgi:hypothetical protein
LYAKYKKQSYTDDQICILADISRSDLANFKDKHRLVTLRLIPEHLIKKAESLGIHPDTVMWRIKNKRWSVEEACTTLKETPIVTTEALDKAKKKFGLHPSTIYRRMARGMGLEEALNTPSKAKRGREIKKKNLPTFMREMKMSYLVKIYREKYKDMSVYEFLEELRKYE